MQSIFRINALWKLSGVIISDSKNHGFNDLVCVSRLGITDSLDCVKCSTDRRMERLMYQILDGYNRVRLIVKFFI